MIGAWEVPVLGTLRNTPIVKIPPEALWSSANVLLRAGFLQPRPGLTRFAATVLTGRPTGLFNSVMLATGSFQVDTFQNDAFQLAGSIPSTLLIVGTVDKLYGYYGGIFNDITGAPDLTALDTQLARFTSMALGTPQTLYVIHTNGMDAPRQWDITSGTFAAVAGTPPNWTDVTNIDQHIIGIVPPYDIRWGPTQSITSWPAANIRVLSDTPDPLVAIASLGVRAGVVYKSRSLWDVIVTGSDVESSYFRFEQRDQVDGPASSAAVINVDGAHMYMTSQGRVAFYNGTRRFWVGDGIWPLVDADIDKANSTRIFGAYDPRFKIAVFCYPKTGDAGECKGWAIVMLPNPAEGYDGFISFHGSSTLAMSAGGDLRLDTFKALFARSDASNQRVYTWEGTTDDGASFDGHFQTGLVGTPGIEFFTLEAYETLALRGAGYGSVTVKPVSSYILNVEGGTVDTGKTLDLTENKVLGSPKSSANLKGRFFGLRYEFTQSASLTLRWLGARLSALFQEVPRR